MKCFAYLNRCVRRSARGILIASVLITGVIVIASTSFASEIGALSSSTDALVNINVASTALLAHKLKGIGPSKAEAIVRYREAHGAFQTIDDLVKVKGIGPKTLEKLKPYIVAGEFIEPKQGESLAEQEMAATEAVQAVVKRSLEIRKAVAAQ